MTNAGDPKAVAKRDKKVKRDQEKLEDAFKWLLNHEQGRKIAWWLLSEAHVFRTSMTGNSQTFFLEGERNVGLKVFDRIMTLAPEKFALMQKEAQAKEQEDLEAEIEPED